MYRFIRSLLFCFEPETAHYLALKGIKLAHLLGFTRLITPTNNPSTVMGLTFPNPVGLAAGLDKDGDYIDALASLGFGFIEIGTVTPKPQAGNTKPRLFRLAKQQAIINRMGFNSKGIDYLIANLKKTNYHGILGINIGKNRDTPMENAIDDYLIGFRRLWFYATYITINISSPNTQGLRDLQQTDSLRTLLSALKQEQNLVYNQYKKYVPLVVKISPDLTDIELRDIATILIEQEIDGVIATNTTIHREGVENTPYANEAGGLSGKPLQARSTHTVSTLHSYLQSRIPIIAVGGIMDEVGKQEKFAAGAKLLQIYTGFIYQGPKLIKSI